MSVHELPVNGQPDRPSPFSDINDNLRAITEHTLVLGRQGGNRDELIGRIGDGFIGLLGLIDQLVASTEAPHRVPEDIHEAASLAGRFTKRLDDPEQAETTDAAQSAITETESALRTTDESVDGIHGLAIGLGQLLAPHQQAVAETLTAMNSHNKDAARNAQAARSSTRNARIAVRSYQQSRPHSDQAIEK